jgi:hypothetical protein
MTTQGQTGGRKQQQQQQQARRCHTKTSAGADVGPVLQSELNF